MSKPHAVPETLICSECGLYWYLHPKNPRRRDCIELLRQEVNKRSTIVWTYCNWGHANCYTYHYASSGSGSGIYFNNSSATITSLPRPEEPPETPYSAAS